MTRALATLIVAILVSPCGIALADASPETTTDDDAFIVEVDEYSKGDLSGPDDGPGTRIEYQWRPACPSDPTTQSGYHTACIELFKCTDNAIPWELRARRADAWRQVRVECRGTSTPALTPAAVSTAFRRIPLPELRSIAQPGDKTLVNFDTIFYVEAETLHRQIRLLGQDVDLTINPSRFRWSFGDGTELVTATQGAAYPAKSLVHRYERAHVTVRHHVEVTWTATWRVNGGPWQDVLGTVTLDGPASPLQVAEAVPLLSNPDR